MSAILICPACKNEVDVTHKEFGYCVACHNPGCKIVVETMLCYPTFKEAEKAWPWKKS